MGAVLRQRRTLLPSKIKPSFHLALGTGIQATNTLWMKLVSVCTWWWTTHTWSLDGSANIRAQIVCMCSLCVRWVRDILGHQSWYLIFLRERSEHVGGKESDVALLTFKQLFIAHGVCPAVGETKQEYLVLKYIVELVFSILCLLAQ